MAQRHAAAILPLLWGERSAEARRQVVEHALARPLDASLSQSDLRLAFSQRVAQRLAPIPEAAGHIDRVVELVEVALEPIPYAPLNFFDAADDAPVREADYSALDAPIAAAAEKLPRDVQVVLALRAAGATDEAISSRTGLAQDRLPLLWRYGLAALAGDAGVRAATARAAVDEPEVTAGELNRRSEAYMAGRPSAVELRRSKF